VTLQGVNAKTVDLACIGGCLDKSLDPPTNSITHPMKGTLPPLLAAFTSMTRLSLQVSRRSISLRHFSLYLSVLFISLYLSPVLAAFTSMTRLSLQVRSSPRIHLSLISPHLFMSLVFSLFFLFLTLTQSLSLVFASEQSHHRNVAAPAELANQAQRPV
jgi:hypothetical protein